MKKFDVIVVGAGPAGSMAACHAAAAGLDVLLLEKHNQIGVPVCCAEAVTKPGLEKLLDPKPSWISTKIESAAVYGPEGANCRIQHPDAGYILERKLFDRDLALIAAEQGAQIKVGTAAVDLIRNGAGFRGVVVEELGERKEYFADLIIAADGVEGVIGRLAGIGKQLSPKMYDSASQFLVTGITLDSSQMEFYFDPDLYPSGYLWVFPKSGHSANVGLGAQLFKHKGPNQREMLEDFCRQRFGAYTVAERTSGGIPAYMGKKYLLKENLLQVGDAARVLDSFTGAGIINGMLSGVLAGKTAGRYLHNGRRPELLRSYPERFLKVKGGELSTYLKARKVFAKLNRKDLISAIEFLKVYFPDGYTTAISGVHLALSLLRHNPRFILLSKELVFG